MPPTGETEFVSIQFDTQEFHVEETQDNIKNEPVRTSIVSQQNVQNVQRTVQSPRVSRSSNISVHTISDGLVDTLSPANSESLATCIDYGPPPYSQLPIYTIPLSPEVRPPGYRPRSFLDPPPPYDPSMRSPFTTNTAEEAYPIPESQTYNRFECKPDTLISIGFCFCSAEQLVIIIALIGTFLFLGLGMNY